MPMLTEEIPIPADILATQKRNPSENSPATSPGSGEAAASAWPSPAHILLLASCIPRPATCILQPSFFILQPEICTLHPSTFIPHPSSCSLHPAACTLQPSFCILQPAPHILHPSFCVPHAATFILHPSCILQPPSCIPDLASHNRSLNATSHSPHPAACTLLSPLVL